MKHTVNDKTIEDYNKKGQHRALIHYEKLNQGSYPAAFLFQNYVTAVLCFNSIFFLCLFHGPNILLIIIKGILLFL